MSRRKHNLIVSGLAAFLAAMTLLFSCVCTPRIDAPVKVEAPVNVAASMPVEVDANLGLLNAKLTTNLAAQVDKVEGDMANIKTVNSGWLIALAISAPPFWILAYMLASRFTSLYQIKEALKGNPPKTGILDAPKPRRTPPAALPVVAKCPRCNATFCPRLDGPPLSPEVEGENA